MSIDNDFFIWPVAFSCVLVLDDIILPNQYNLTIGMMPVGSESTAMGLRKIKEFISRFVQNSILIRSENQFLSQLGTLRSNTLQLPQDPSDYLFAAVLFRKLNAISADHFTIGQLTIDSSVGDRVKYHISNNNDVYSEILEQDMWWTQDNVNTNHSEQFPTWEELDIGINNKFSPKLVKGGKHDNKSIR